MFTASTNSQPDTKEEVDLTKNPNFKKIPQYYKDTFPGLFDQSNVNKYQ